MPSLLIAFVTRHPANGATRADHGCALVRRLTSPRRRSSSSVSRYCVRLRPGTAVPRRSISVSGYFLDSSACPRLTKLAVPLSWLSILSEALQALRACFVS
ncbi:hypothetical protein CALVIDRAFT_73102 [Calocera viscosa TUFC12733]|uniref:Uncharacterized protein n=1 Tax=Calocera viscosa (strain TUFC12733) TaxID=1330018 RepID=A0A167NCA3_CALVF|nr:hypothetical protein CALVIDRAFT_73102 [Calocera viscosa TUFC12733]